MMKKISELWNKHKELLLYVLFGGLTTLVNFVTFWLCSLLLGEDLYLISNAIAWIVSVLFAYFTNKLFVFDSKSFAPHVVVKEFLEFLAARVFSFVVEELGMWLFVDLLGFDGFAFELFGFRITGQLIAKLILAVIVVIMNYFFSKFFIFKKNEK